MTLLSYKVGNRETKSYEEAQKIAATTKKPIQSIYTPVMKKTASPYSEAESEKLKKYFRKKREKA